MPTSNDLSDLTRELAITRRMLERYPDGRGAWRPHPKSRTLAELASHVAQIPGLGIAILTTDFLDFSTRPPAQVHDASAALVAAFDEVAAGVTAAAAKATESDLARKWGMGAGKHVVAEGTKGDMLRLLLLSHIIHHRAQLGVYYRLLDIPLPSTYGPSADEGH